MSFKKVREKLMQMCAELWGAVTPKRGTRKEEDE